MVAPLALLRLANYIFLFPIRPGFEIVENNDGPLLHGFCAEVSDVRRKEAVWRREEGMIGGNRRFGFIHIDACPSNGACFECFCKCRVVDDGTAGSIDKDGVWLHFLDLLFADDATSFIREGEVHRNDVARGENGVKICIMDGFILGRAVVAPYIAAKGAGDFCGAAADGAGADDAKPFASKLESHEAGIGTAIPCGRVCRF